MFICTCSWESTAMSKINFLYITQYNVNFFEEYA